MSFTQQRKRKIHKAKPRRYRTNPHQEVLTTLPTLARAESFPHSPQATCPEPSVRPACPPAAPHALTIPAAWRSLCRRTGAGICLSTFYLWTRQGRIETIRVGWRVFIRAEVVDRLVEMALHGESW